VGMNKPFLPTLPTSPTLPTLPTFQISLKHRTLVCTLYLEAGKSAKCKDDIETTSLEKEPRNASKSYHKYILDF
jgi:hypothetical protein